MIKLGANGQGERKGGLEPKDAGLAPCSSTESTGCRSHAPSHTSPAGWRLGAYGMAHRELGSVAVERLLRIPPEHQSSPSYPSLLAVR